jgi:CubicO group peptidase (beta-lactamase class C family)
MVDTGFQVPEAKLDRLPGCYGTDLVTGKLVVLEEARGGYAARSPAFESGAGGLVSTVDDLLAFGQMMLVKGAHGGERVLSRPSIELMTMDHLTPAQKAVSPFFESFWDTYGWGLGLGIVTARHDLADAPGRFGWDGAFGTSWHVDPKEELVGVLMTQRRPDRLALSPLALDFWNSAYQLIDS